MSSLQFQEKQILESVLEMASGGVLNLSRRELESFFSDFQISIFDPKYASYGKSDSKANCLRAFWTVENDTLVGKATSALLDLAEQCAQEPFIHPMLPKARSIVARIKSITPTQSTICSETDEFLETSLPEVSFKQLISDPILLESCNRRLEEIYKCYESTAYLACIIMIGSLLEGILHGVAQNSPQQFNQSIVSPKDSKSGDVKSFSDWTLDNLINVACNLNLLSEDVKKHCSSVKDFRNYIHPKEQCRHKFHPDQYTARIALQVLTAAIANLNKQRSATSLEVIV